MSARKKAQRRNPKRPSGHELAAPLGYAVTIPKNTIICDRHVRSHLGEYLIRNYTPRELSVTITEHEIIIREA